ncbi:MAG: acetyl-CoA carboxylase biotin carboxyl carrier protein subunit [Ignavibacteriae bacterium]|nr:acetyl-CoA carboxylase biotin carboxyl carrier protein subunit [Ignavibacteriota bacterium]
MKKYKVQIQSKEFFIEDFENGIIGINGNSFEIQTSKQSKTMAKRVADNQYEVWIKNYHIPVTLMDEKSVLLAQMQKKSVGKDEMIVKAPMPGLVVAVEVHVGDVIAPGTGLIILEAMKMENEIRSQVKARVKKIDVEKSARVEKGQTLIHLESVE